MSLMLMSLGLAPLPAKTTEGRKHIPEGCRENNTGGGAHKTRREAAAARRAKVLAMIRDEPSTSREIMEEFDVLSGVVDEDLRVLMKTEGVRKRMHKGECIYWVAQ